MVSSRFSGFEEGEQGAAGGLELPEVGGFAVEGVGLPEAEDDADPLEGQARIQSPNRGTRLWHKTVTPPGHPAHTGPLNRGTRPLSTSGTLWSRFEHSIAEGDRKRVFGRLDDLQHPESSILRLKH